MNSAPKNNFQTLRGIESRNSQQPTGLRKLINGTRNALLTCALASSLVACGPDIKTQPEIGAMKTERAELKEKKSNLVANLGTELKHGEGETAEKLRDEINKLDDEINDLKSDIDAAEETLREMQAEAREHARTNTLTREDSIYLYPPQPTQNPSQQPTQPNNTSSPRQKVD